MKKIINLLKFLIPLSGLIYLILVFLDSRFLISINKVMSTILALYSVVFAVDGIIIKKSKDFVYIFYFFFWNYDFAV